WSGCMPRVRAMSSRSRFSSAEIGGRLPDIEFAERNDGVMESSFVAWPAPDVPVDGRVAVSARRRAHLATRLATRLGRVRDGVAQPRRSTHGAAAHPSRGRSQALLQRQSRALELVVRLDSEHPLTHL